jgi:hypothetical protein
MYQEYEPHGYRLHPSHVSEYDYPMRNPRKLTVISNRHGFRSSRQFDAVDSRTRVLVIGDSLVFGEGVEERERFTDVLETMEPAWRVDNLGMTGYGPDLMLMALERVGLSVNPDVVVFVMYTDDFRRVHPYYAGMGFKIPRFKIKRGELIKTPYPELNALDRMHIFQTLYRVYWKYSDAQWELSQAILDRFLKLGKSHKFAPAIIFLPGIADTKNDKRRRYWLRDYTQNKQTPFLDLSDPIHNAGVNRVFIPKNHHLNPEGHRIVARELERFLVQRIVATPRLKMHRRLQDR